MKRKDKNQRKKKTENGPQNKGIKQGRKERQKTGDKIKA